MKLVGVLMAGLALAACGGDDDGGDEVNSGGDLDGKQLSSLTAEESQAVCQDLAASATVTKEDVCEIAGAFASAFGGADCEATKAECMSEPEQPPPDEGCATAGFTDCTATVAEYKACMTAQVQALKAITCATPLDTAAEPPAACAALSEKCPEILGGQAGGA
ncbi:hypothetical protein BE15_08660 [Sorangium cellulosum]|uniref:Uncharacterized protein n=2 Tax=Polyangiaceae TaxID=49 RepID=A0A150PZ40_SORCE|nr:hypothetical protein BE15_08660 [Sorangium cellulosum]